MFNFQDSIFSCAAVTDIPPDARVIIVSDMFADEYAGGAELTTQGLIDASPFKVHCVRSKDVTLELLRKGVDRFWVFGNYAQLNVQLIPSIVGNLRYTILEYDFKFCRFRSPDKHLAETGQACDCDQQMNGKVISAFMYGSMGIWWMSERQKDLVHTRFPFLREKDNIVLSSIFPASTLGRLKLLREARAKLSEDEFGPYVVLGSPSWIKGKDDAIKRCEDDGLEYEVIWNLPYEELLAKLSTSKGHVYLPKGGDTCPRMIIEARLMGVPLIINDNVMHGDEEWFDTENITVTEEYLLAAPGLFWKGVKRMMDYEPTISGYTTTYNCASQGYPFEESIRSMMQFCDEVCVVDGGSSDETLWRLYQLAKEFNDDLPQTFVEDMDAYGPETIPAMLQGQGDGYRIDSGRLKIKVIKRDWSHPRHAVFDGMQKAEARRMCTKEFCWQMDSDEVVHEADVEGIKRIVRNLPPGTQMLALPVIEYWGSADKVRMDIMPWKWRVSRNDPHITHGIPVHLRKTDGDGQVYAADGTDGCDPIDAETGKPIPFINFYTSEVDNARRIAMMGNEGARQQYEQWFNHIIMNLPSVFHYSWLDIPRKMRLYRDYWQNHWNALYDKDTSDTAENNMFFDVPWSEVTDEMIEARGGELAEKTGGWIWHRKWRGQTVPHISITREQPGVMR